jgi:hypothetical protein
LRSWRIPAINKCKELLATEKFDAILTSSYPLTSHCIAVQLKKHFNIPWLADLRDLWTQHHNYLYPWRRFIEKRLEIKTLSQANVLTTVSESLLKKLKNHFPEKKISVILNGFDPASINDCTIPLTKKFTITYTGLTYEGKQNPAKLFEALQQLLAEGRIDKTQIEIRFYGVQKKWISHLASLYNVESLVTQYGPMLHDKITEKQRESWLLLLFGWDDEYETGVLPIKMFEYFAARRPILATGGTPNEQFRTILDNTQAGKHAIEIPEIKNILEKYYQEYINTGSLAFRGIPSELDKYSYREMAKRFAEELDKLAS